MLTSKSVLVKIARLEKELELLSEVLAECNAYPSSYYFADEREDIARRSAKADELYQEITRLKGYL